MEMFIVLKNADYLEICSSLWMSERSLLCENGIDKFMLHCDNYHLVEKRFQGCVLDYTELCVNTIVYFNECFGSQRIYVVAKRH